MIARKDARTLSPRVLAALGAMVAVYGMAAALVSSGMTAQHPAIASGLAIDLTVTATLAVYLLAVRPGHLPPMVLVPVLVIGVGISRWFLPATPIVAVVSAAVGAFEVVALGVTLTRVWRASRATGQARAAGASLLDALEHGIAGIGLPRRVTAILAAELAIVTRAITGWRRPRREPGHFTMHVEKGASLIIGVFVALAIVEAAGLHWVLMSRTPVLAWVLTGLSIYGVLWLLGDLHAIRHGGVRLSDSGLRLDVGVRWRAELAWDDIEAIERIDAVPDGAVKATVLEPTALVRLNRPVRVLGPIGRIKHTTAIAITVDDTPRFLDEVARWRRGPTTATPT